MTSKHDEALNLADELLSNIELNQLRPVDIVRKASRLARLTDDSEAMQWLSYEVGGYPEGGTELDPAPWQAAVRANRIYLKENTKYARTSSIGQIEASIGTAQTQLSIAPTVVLQNGLRKQIVEHQGVIDRILGAVHTFVVGKYQELRFGAAVETAFETIRATVDASISNLVPDALPILTTALENASDSNPVQWNNAAKACRDLIKATADALRPAGKAKAGRPMTDAHYVNRLVDWIESQSTGDTTSQMIISDLEDLGKRLDAITDGGNKGAHAQVTKQEASRFIVGTYMFIGDVLALNDTPPSAPENQPIDEKKADSAEAELPKESTPNKG